MMTKKPFESACIVFFCYLSVVIAVQFKDCGSVKGNVESVSVSGSADGASSCVLKRGSTTNVTINFKISQAISTIKAEVHGVIGGIPLPFPLPHNNGCLNSGLQCPLIIGHMYSYSTSIPVLEMYPQIPVKVKWELQDTSDSKDLVCIEIDSKLE